MSENKTIVVSGATGYVAGWVVHECLERGYTVRGSARDPGNPKKVGHLTAMAEKLPGTLELFKADLLAKGAFDEACDGADAVIHTASPFILNPKDAQRDLVDPALKGTMSVLDSVNKAESVKRVVLTSSQVAVYGDSIDYTDKPFTEDDWNSTSSLDHQPYPYSKTVAERAAWKAYEAQDRWQLTTMNPGFVLGPSLNKRIDGESNKLMSDMLRGKMSMGAPGMHFGVVDVRDLAHAHVEGAVRDDVEGRHNLIAGHLWILEIANALRDKYGDRKLPKRTVPKPLMYVVGPLLGFSWKYVSRNVGHEVRIDNSKSREKLGIEYRDLKQTVLGHAAQLIADNLA